MQVACVGERLVPAIGVLLLGIAGPLEVRERVRVGRRHPPRITPGENERTLTKLISFLTRGLLRNRPPLSLNRQAQPRMPGGGSTSKRPRAQLVLSYFYYYSQQDRSGLDAGRRLDLEGAGRHGAHLIDRLGERGAHQLRGGRSSGED